MTGVWFAFVTFLACYCGFRQLGLLEWNIDLEGRSGQKMSCYMRTAEGSGMALSVGSSVGWYCVRTVHVYIR